MQISKMICVLVLAAFINLVSEAVVSHSQTNPHNLHPENAFIATDDLGLDSGSTSVDQEENDDKLIDHVGSHELALESYDLVKWIVDTTVSGSKEEQPWLYNRVVIEKYDFLRIIVITNVLLLQHYLEEVNDDGNLIIANDPKQVSKAFDVAQGLLSLFPVRFWDFQPIAGPHVDDEVVKHAMSTIQRFIKKYINPLNEQEYINFQQDFARLYSYPDNWPETKDTTAIDAALNYKSYLYSICPASLHDQIDDNTEKVLSWAYAPSNRWTYRFLDSANNVDSELALVSYNHVMELIADTETRYLDEKERWHNVHEKIKEYDGTHIVVFTKSLILQFLMEKCNLLVKFEGNSQIDFHAFWLARSILSLLPVRFWDFQPVAGPHVDDEVIKHAMSTIQRFIKEYINPLNEQQYINFKQDFARLYSYPDNWPETKDTTAIDAALNYKSYLYSVCPATLHDQIDDNTEKVLSWAYAPSNRWTYRFLDSANNVDSELALVSYNHVMELIADTESGHSHEKERWRNVHEKIKEYDGTHIVVFTKSLILQFLIEECNLLVKFEGNSQIDFHAFWLARSILSLLPVRFWDVHPIAGPHVDDEVVKHAMRTIQRFIKEYIDPLKEQQYINFQQDFARLYSYPDNWPETKDTTAINAVLNYKSYLYSVCPATLHHQIDDNTEKVLSWVYAPSDRLAKNFRNSAYCVSSEWNWESASDSEFKLTVNSMLDNLVKMRGLDPLSKKAENDLYEGYCFVEQRCSSISYLLKTVLKSNGAAEDRRQVIKELKNRRPKYCQPKAEQTSGCFCFLSRKTQDTVATASAVKDDGHEAGTSGSKEQDDIFGQSSTVNGDDW